MIFGPFELDPEAGELRKHGIRIRLSGQPFRILLMLMEHHGALVTREQLRDRIWNDGTFVDFEGGLNAVINKLRRALNDSAENPITLKPFRAADTGSSDTWNLVASGPLRPPRLLH